MVKIQLEPCRGLREKLWTKKVGRIIIIIIIIITKKRRIAISLPSGDLKRNNINTIRPSVEDGRP